MATQTCTAHSIGSDGRTLPVTIQERDLLERYLDGANLAGANLAGANLVGANLVGANLAGANLDGANLAGAYLAGANLVGANLDGANLAGAYLAGAYLAGAYLDGATVTGAPARMGTCRSGYELLIWPVIRDDVSGVVIRCGCRTFNGLAEAREHWGGGHPAPLRARMRRAQLDAYEADPDAWHERETVQRGTP